MLLDDVADYLSTQGIGTVGSTGDWGIFKSLMPPEPNRCVALFETGGTAPYRAMSASAGSVPAERPRVQVVVRGNAFDYEQARSKANDIFKKLDQLGDVTINSVRYLWVAGAQSPFGIGVDENNRPEVVCNYDVVKALT